MPPANIMIIDPSGECALNAVKELLPQGHNVMTASSCDRAIELMSLATPNLIIIDGDLGYSPLEWLDIVQKNQWPAQIIAAVDKPDFKQAMQWVSSGLFCVIEKTIDGQSLRNFASKALEASEIFQSIISGPEDVNAQHRTEINNFYQNLVGQISLRPLKKYVVEALKLLLNANDVEIKLSNSYDQLSHNINTCDDGICIDDKITDMADIDISSKSYPRSISYELSQQQRYLGEMHIYFKQQQQLIIKDQSLMLEIVDAVSASLHAAFKYNKAIAMASRDGLTGLYNRRIFNEVLKREFANAQRHKYQLSLLSLDLDHFKSVNDNFGHQTGDQVLKAVARLMGKAARVSDTAARIGGEEFAIILPHTSQEQAYHVAKRFKNMLASANIDLGGTIFKQTVSQGIASMEHFMVKSPEDMLYLADQALYMAKREGRDTIRSADDLPMTPCMKDGPYAFQ